MIETHDRMPVIISEHEVRAYLTDPIADAEIIEKSSPSLTGQEL